MNCLIAQFYHVWADGNWEIPLSEHVAAMKEAAFPGGLHVGIIGTDENQERVTKWLDNTLPDGWTLAASASEGYEEVTVMAARDWATKNEGFVLYAHDKGAMNSNNFETEWRQRLTHELVTNWDRCIRLLATADAVGCHWLTAEQEWPRPWPADGNWIGVTHKHFSGNFWWATTDYMRKLPEWPFEIPHYEGCCYPKSVPQAKGQTTGRWLTELWIGLGNPKVVDLYPGMPGEYNREKQFSITWR